MNSLLQEIANFTKEDWQEFDRLKNLVFQPTQEEIEKQKEEQEKQKQSLINSKLKAIWIEKPETITREIVLNLLEKLNAKQWIWDDYNKFIDNQIVLFWDLNTAFENLLINNL